MNFNDNDKDYFLHDFSKSEADPSVAADTPAAAAADSPSSSPQSPSFDFTDGRAVAPTERTKKNRLRGCLTWAVCITVVVIAVTVWIRYYVPYVTESKVTGYVTTVEKRGIIFKTFEGEMVSEEQFATSNRVYSRDINFSIPDSDLARRLQQYQASGQPVTVTCKRYYGVLPWRGASTTIVVSFTPVTPVAPTR